MDYIIDEETLKGSVEFEVSQVADAAYAEDGTPLYDSVVLTEKDDDTVLSFIDDAIRVVISALQDIAYYATSTSTDETSHVTTVTNKITFNVPDFDASQGGQVTLNIDSFVKAFVCAGLFRQRRPSLVEEYVSRAQIALDNVKSLLRKRQAPTRS